MNFVKSLLIGVLVILVYIPVYAELSPANQQFVDSLRKAAIVDPEGVEKNIDSLVEAAFKDGDSLKYAKLLDTRGRVKRDLGDFAEALKNHHQAYDIYNLLGNKTAVVGSLNSLGVVLLRMKEYEEAAGYFLQGLQATPKSDSSMLKVLYSNLGVAYDYSGKTLLAIDIYKKAALYTEPDDDHSIGVNFHNIAVCYDMLADYKMAEAYELKALEHQKKSGNLDLLARIVISLGGVYLDQGNDIKKAEYYLKIGGETAEKINSIELLEEYYEHAIDLYVVKNETKKALEFFDKLNTLKARIYSEENSKNIAEAETRFKLSVKNKEIENLKIRQNLLDLRMERDRLLRYVMFIIVLLSLILIFIMYRNYLLRKKNFALLAREKQLAESEKRALERNNEYLYQENMLARFEILKSQVSPHFLFNTLNALSFLIESDPEKAVDFTNAFSKLFRTVLELKDQNLITLEQELSHVKAYFFLQHTRFGENLLIDQHIEPAYLNQKLPPFSIQIAVENAINHNVVSDEAPLKIKIFGSGNFLIIENNLQPRLHAVKSTSMGIANIRARYSYFTSIAPEFNKTESSFIVRLPLL